MVGASVIATVLFEQKGKQGVREGEAAIAPVHAG
jgi:hypothetical protein